MNNKYIIIYIILFLLNYCSYSEYIFPITAIDSDCLTLTDDLTIDANSTCSRMGNSDYSVNDIKCYEDGTIAFMMHTDSTTCYSTDPIYTWVYPNACNKQIDIINMESYYFDDDDFSYDCHLCNKCEAKTFSAPIIGYLLEFPVYSDDECTIPEGLYDMQFDTGYECTVWSHANEEYGYTFDSVDNIECFTDGSVNYWKYAGSADCGINFAKVENEYPEPTFFSIEKDYCHLEYTQLDVGMYTMISPEHECSYCPVCLEPAADDDNINNDLPIWSEILLLLFIFGIMFLSSYVIYLLWIARKDDIDLSNHVELDYYSDGHRILLEED